MDEFPETRESLLLEIQSQENQAAWVEFVEIYRPVVYGVATSRGLQHADALDLVQVVFISIAKSIPRWEKKNSNTRFRHWLMRVAKNATINALTRRPADEALGGEAFLEGLVEAVQVEPHQEQDLDLAYQRQIYLRAAEKVRAQVAEENWRAFEMTAIDGVSIETAAQELGKSPGAIYAARCRIMKQLTRHVSHLEDL